MLSRKNIISLSIIVGIISWLLLTAIDLVILFSELNASISGISPLIPKIFLVLMLLSMYLAFRNLLMDTESINIIDLLWRVFVTGLVVTIVSLAIWLFKYLLSDSKLIENPMLNSFFYHVNIGLVSIFVVSTFVVWKKLILYQKSKSLVKTWRVFLYAITISLFFIFFDLEMFDMTFNVVLAILVVMAIILSANLKWVAYLNFKQKWKSILLIVLIILYLWYLVLNMIELSTDAELPLNLMNNVTLIALFSFIFIYAIFSLLVILFNLPTSSVFEQKLEEVINFQRLSQSSQTGQNEDQVFDILLDSSVSAVMADAAWLEVQSENEVELKLLTFKINRERIQEVKKQIDHRKIKKVLDTDPSKNLKGSRYLGTVQNSNYKSILAFPIYVQSRQVGTLVLLKDVYDGFNKEMVEIIRTFVSQASISIENFRLLSEAIVNERYKEELKIAKRVQRSLLPDKLEEHEMFELAAFSKAADEVGGDYYDSFKFNDHKIAVIIGDVSGKGTSAAFHMSQMKGVFHSLVQLDLSSREFMAYANNALSRCLEKTSFITVSFFIIDVVAKTLDFARAGHCPTLFYSAEDNTTTFFKGKGLGLGILRNNTFTDYMEVENIQYKSGDIVFLYTDGIVEAKNKDNEFFGYERLRNFLMRNAHRAPNSLQADLLRELYTFCDKEPPNDDFTTLIIKFK